jgi:hypothetical protein
VKISLLQRDGLGNQLFRYAAALYFAEKHSARLEILMTPGLGDNPWGHPRAFQLSKYKIASPCRRLSRLDIALCGGGRKSAALRYALRAQSYDHRTEDSFMDSLPASEGTRNVYLSGYFQVYQYAEIMEAKLRKELVAKASLLEENTKILRHIRDSDFTKDWSGTRLLPMTYYMNATATMRKLYSNPTFFVFSDDMHFARTELSRVAGTVFVDQNGEDSAVEDLQLMSSCRHHIIGNSTFSWWGAWLNSDKNKCVLAPSSYWPISMVPPSNLLPPTWSQVSV